MMDADYFVEKAEQCFRLAKLVPLHSDYDSLVLGSRPEAGSG